MSSEAAVRALESLGAWAWRASWQGACLAAIVALVVWAFGRRVSPAWRFGLWGLVLVRLAMPAVIEVRWAGAPRAGVWEPAEPQAAGVTRADGDRVRAPVAGAGGAVAPIRELTQAEFDAVTATAAVAPVAPEVAAPRSAPRRVPWATVWPWLAGAWLAGVVVLAARVLLASVRLSRAVARTPLVTDPRVLRTVAECCRAMGVRRAPEARELPAGGGPALVGFVRPKVWLPLHVLGDLADDELRLIVLHELAHVRRRDVLVNWLATAVAVLHWPNPAAWLVIWRMRTERELACDELVLRVGQDPGGRAYARTIVKLVEALSAAAAGGRPGGDLGGRVPAAVAAVPGGAVGILEGKAQIQRRLQMIARFDATGRRTPAVAAAVALVVGGLALAGATRAADSNDANPTKGVEKTKTTATEGGESGKVTEAPKTVQGTTTTTTAAPAAGGAKKPAGGPAAHPADPSGHGEATTASTTTVAGGGGGPVIAPRRAAPPDDPANAATVEKLKKTLPEVRFDGVPFGNVIDFIRDVSGLDFLVEWRALEEIGVERSTPVTINVRNVRVDAAMSLIFRSMGGMLHHEVDKGVVVIFPSEGRAKEVTRVYDVGELVGEGVAAPVVAPRGGGGGFAPRGGMGASDDLNQLIVLITTTIQPADWTSQGGSVASISSFKSKLVIKAPETTHREVMDLLEMLREKPRK
jgi:beta-lactamase regulating signal transducer with metallopeptidase domain